MTAPTRHAPLRGRPACGLLCVTGLALAPVVAFADGLGGGDPEPDPPTHWAIHAPFHSTDPDQLEQYDEGDALGIHGTGHSNAAYRIRFKWLDSGSYIHSKAGMTNNNNYWIENETAPSLPAGDEDGAQMSIVLDAAGNIRDTVYIRVNPAD